MSDVARARPWEGLPLSAEVTAVPAMLTDEERRYYIWLTQTAYRGFGAVVDLGPWVGASTAALAEGLRRAGRSEQVRSFDLFRWSRDYMEPLLPANLADGADFQPLFETYTRPWGDLVRGKQMDLLHPHWSGEPIEILFVDAAKSWELTDAILRHFMPYLVPERSRVVLQDFRHYHTYWLPLVFDSQPQLWREIEATRHGTTVTFVPRRALDPARDLPPRLETDTYPTSQAVELFEARIAAEEPHNQPYSLLGLLRKALVVGEKPLVRQLEQRIRSHPHSKQFAPWIESAIRLSHWEVLGAGFRELELGHVAQARESLLRLRQLFPPEPEIEFLAGMIHRAEGEGKTAERCFLLAAAGDPERVHALLHAADLAVNEGGDGAGLDRRIVALLAAGPLLDKQTSYWTFGLLEHIWRRIGSLERANEGIERLRSRCESNAAFQVLRGILAQEGGDSATAQEAWKRALELDPDVPRARELVRGL